MTDSKMADQLISQMLVDATVPVFGQNAINAQLQQEPVTPSGMITLMINKYPQYKKMWTNKQMTKSLIMNRVKIVRDGNKVVCRGFYFKKPLNQIIAFMEEQDIIASQQAIMRNQAMFEDKFMAARQENQGFFMNKNQQIQFTQLPGLFDENSQDQQQE
ncbi:Hypothetical_protein [Hexamita inflata]|uniref:Hypothetical_protein n=1 Tax=Hexamita inflata TaxID=28002 RepID=A0AA86TXS4_9EUKA|nr:Hypothetical protein HINF_LOCUS21180 [Hexamita inflata]